MVKIKPIQKIDFAAFFRGDGRVLSETDVSSSSVKNDICCQCERTIHASGIFFRIETCVFLLLVKDEVSTEKINYIIVE
jgi:hypothetical protein